MKPVFAIFICLCLGAPLTVSAAGTNDGAANIPPVAAQDASSIMQEERSESAEAVAAGANAFAFRLSAKLAQQAGDGNLVCAPYCVWLPLAALVNAADDPHKAEVLATLDVAGISEEDINQAALRMLYDLTMDETRIENHTPLKIANAIFVDQKYTLKSNFTQVFQNFYQGTAMNLDFASQEAAEAANQWASDNTEGLITNIVQEFAPCTVAAIANAVYFSDRWLEAFSPAGTEKGVFHSPAGKTSAFFMQRDSRCLYYEDEAVQALPLSFQQGGALHIILPKNGNAVGLLSSMTSEDFLQIIEGYEYKRGKLRLPRFFIESEVMNLADTLIALGVPLFDENKPLLSELINEDVLWISDACQKAMIEVDEYGSVAAAAALKMLRTPKATRSPEEPFEMICNKPFVFVLYGSNQVLFTGVVNQP